MKKVNIIVDAFIFIAILAQMLYVFEGNLVHEILGMLFFAFIVVHIIMKRKVILGMLKKKTTGWVTVSKVVIILLVLSILALMVTSIAVSRILFPFPGFPGSVELHTLLATITLALSVAHACLYFIIRAPKEKKKKCVIISVILTIIGFSIGYFGVPYVNRHFKKVTVELESIKVEKCQSAKENKILTVYFTRNGNTDFEEDVDAVSGASLMLTDGELMGSNELLAYMVKEAADCDTRAITLTGEKYPSSYGDTVSVGGSEIRNNARPSIDKIDISDYDSVILIYPVWWGTIPMPVATFLEDNDWDGKTLNLIATHGGTGFGSSADDIRELVPAATVVEGLSIYCDDIPKASEEIRLWLENTYR